MKQTTWKENRTVALAVLCGVILLSICGIGSMKTKQVGAKAAAYYAQNMANDYALRTQAAQSIVSVGEGVLDANDTALQTAQKAVQAAQKAQGPAQQASANNAMQAGVGLLYETLRSEMSGDKGGVLQTQWSEFLSRGNILANETQPYNALADAAKQKLDGFPASLLAKLAGAQVEHFGNV